jgi:hypothetical protein
VAKKRIEELTQRATEKHRGPQRRKEEGVRSEEKQTVKLRLTPCNSVFKRKTINSKRQTINAFGYEKVFIFLKNKYPQLI